MLGELVRHSSEQILLQNSQQIWTGTRTAIP